MADIDVAVIGGGVVGLAAAAALAERGASVCVLETAARPGHGTSTRNSGVIHAGIYYPTGSLKAQLSVEGRERLYAFCAAHAVPHARCGKLIVAATAAEADALAPLAAQAHANGVGSVAPATLDFVRRREPAIAAVAALWSPDTGIVEAEALVRALVAVCRVREVGMVVASPLVDAAPASGGVALVTPRERFVAGTVVNAAGLHADDVSARLGAQAFRIHPCRGEYAELAPGRRGWVNGLVYPLPHPSGAGLGVHLTRTTHGSVLIGPTIRYQAGKDDYESDRLPLEAFVEPTRALLPGVTLADLQPGGTGIRAKLHGPERTFADFLIGRDPVNPHVIQAAGIDSPGLTSCLAIGARVAAIWADGA
ncbi:MAG: NAD(P)/FAD-dependent oxidoreductase [Vicinamibacterales bacterium]